MFRNRGFTRLQSYNHWLADNKALKCTDLQENKKDGLIFFLKLYYGVNLL